MNGIFISHFFFTQQIGSYLISDSQPCRALHVPAASPNLKYIKTSHTVTGMLRLWVDFNAVSKTTAIYWEFDLILDQNMQQSLSLCQSEFLT